MLLYKNLSQGISDVDVKKGIVTGYFSSFDNMDSDGDVIRKGAFTKTINENFQRVRHLLDHDSTKSVGKILSLKEDTKGLYYESKAGRHTLGRDFLLMVEDGLISEHSIGFVTPLQLVNLLYIISINPIFNDYNCYHPPLSLAPLAFSDSNLTLS
jgi:phage head maturation protease